VARRTSRVRSPVPSSPLPPAYSRGSQQLTTAVLCLVLTHRVGSSSCIVLYHPSGAKSVRDCVAICARHPHILLLCYKERRNQK
jgi:hypothetical protein